MGDGHYMLSPQNNTSKGENDTRVPESRTRPVAVGEGDPGDAGDHGGKEYSNPSFVNSQGSF